MTKLIQMIHGESGRSTLVPEAEVDAMMLVGWFRRDLFAARQAPDAPVLASSNAAPAVNLPAPVTPPTIEEGG